MLDYKNYESLKDTSYSSSYDTLYTFLDEGGAVFNYLTNELVFSDKIFNDEETYDLIVARFTDKMIERYCIADDMIEYAILCLPSIHSNNSNRLEVVNTESTINYIVAYADEYVVIYPM